jgi:CRP-like cAMP-binding protein
MSKQPLEHFTVRYGAGEVVYREGDPGTTMFVVQNGDVQLFTEVEGEERELSTLSKGDFFGEMSILESLPRTTSARAISGAELLEINGSTFDKMIKGNIEIAVRLLRKLSLRLREAERKNARLQSESGRRATVASRVPDATPVSVERAAPTGARLEIDAETIFAICGHECMIGRFDPVTESKPDVDLTDVDLKRSVSRRHARIVRGTEGYELIEEIGALNGTFVNGERLTTGEAQILADGDHVNVGTVQLRFRC